MEYLDGLIRYYTSIEDPKARKGIANLVKSLSNIKDDSDVMNVWNDLQDFCSEKKSSHFISRRRFFLKGNKNGKKRQKSLKKKAKCGIIPKTAKET